MIVGWSSGSFPAPGLPHLIVKEIAFAGFVPHHLPHGIDSPTFGSGKREEIYDGFMVVVSKTIDGLVKQLISVLP